MHINKLTRIIVTCAEKADKSAVGAINRPLRMVGFPKVNVNVTPAKSRREQSIVRDGFLLVFEAITPTTPRMGASPIPTLIMIKPGPEWRLRAAYRWEAAKGDRQIQCRC